MLNLDASKSLYYNEKRWFVVQWSCGFPQIFPINVKGPAGSIINVVSSISGWIVSYSFSFILEWNSAGDALQHLICFCFFNEFVMKDNCAYCFWYLCLYLFLCCQVLFSYLLAFLVLVFCSSGRWYQKLRGELWKKYKHPSLLMIPIKKTAIYYNVYY